MKNTFNLLSLTQRAHQLANWLRANKEFPAGLVLYVFAHPMVVEAGFLSKAICRPYKQLVDNELFVVIAAVVAVVLVIVWKFSPSGTVMTRFVGLLAALAVGMNIENILQAATGVGIAC